MFMIPRALTLFSFVSIRRRTIYIDTQSMQDMETVMNQPSSCSTSTKLLESIHHGSKSLDSGHHLISYIASVDSGRHYASMTSRIQSFGETVFGAALLISFIQAVLALYQYRSNPHGELVFPDGLTYGIESPPSLSLGAGDDHLEDGTVPKTSVNGEWDALHEIQTLVYDTKDTLEERKKDDGQFDVPKVANRFMYKVNKMAVIFLPWVARHLNLILTKNSHLIHIFFIISLASTFDFWRPTNIDQGDVSKLSVMKKLGQRRTEQNIVVIGDSLAIGLGCVEQFDETKNYTLPMARIEKLSLDKNNRDIGERVPTSPVFPRVFARTMAEKLNQTVRWRSAGVDGGTVDDINHYCIGIIQEEVQKGNPPDVVIVLCGINDLKLSLSSPMKTKFTHSFLSSMGTLIRSIKQHVPNAVIIFPALPVQMFHKNSVVNILPLSIFLDSVAGFWDAQKKRLADKSSDVEYFGLTPHEILSWYQNDDDDKSIDKFLIAPDGVHPNKRCYSKWAETISKKFCDHIIGCSLKHLN